MLSVCLSVSLTHPHAQFMLGQFLGAFGTSCLIVAVTVRTLTQNDTVSEKASCDKRWSETAQSESDLNLNSEAAEAAPEVICVQGGKVLAEDWGWGSGY